MKRIAWFLPLVFFFSCLPAAFAINNSWTSASGGWWETAGSWSMFMAPMASHDVYITNANTKTVSITGTGPGPFSTIQSLTIESPDALYTNTLVVNAFEEPNKLTVTDLLAIGNDGIFRLNNSTAQVHRLWTGGGELHVSSGTFICDADAVLAGFSRLNISGGGAFRATNTYVGEENGFGCSTGLVNGAGSTMTNLNYLYVGQGADNNVFSIESGAGAFNRVGIVGIKAQGHGHNNALTLTGSGSVWSNRDMMMVGAGVCENSVTVGNGAQGYGAAVIGAGSGSDSNALTVTGSGSAWSGSSFEIGQTGSWNRLVIADGGAVQTVTVLVGRAEGAIGNSIEVSGAGSRLAVGGGGEFNLIIGEDGDRSELVISDGGQVAANMAFVGYEAGADSNRVTVSGTGSVWSNNQVSIGENGSYNQLIITNGGRVVATNEDYSFYVGGSEGTTGGNLARVTGTGSVLQAEVIAVGLYGSGNRLECLDGGQILSSNVMTFANGNNDMLVSGTGSVWSNAGSISIGNNASAYDHGLVVSNGAGLVSDMLTISCGENGLGHAIFSGAGTWGRCRVLWVQGFANYVLVTNGAELVAGTIYMPYDDPNYSATDCRLVVDGGQLESTNLCSIGEDGDAQLTVNAGTTLLRNVSLGGAGKGAGESLAPGDGRFTINGGTNRIDGTLAVAATSTWASGTVSIQGGELSVTNGTASIGQWASGQLLLGGGRSTWQDVRIGEQAGGSGTAIADGGTNTVLGQFSIGHLAGSTGAVQVSGGRLVVTNAPLLVGNAGIGQLTLAGGTLAVQELRVGEAAGSRGSLTMMGGDFGPGTKLDLGEQAGSTGTALFDGGTFTAPVENIGYYGTGMATQTGGTNIVASALILAAQPGSSGMYDFRGGTLSAPGVEIRSNGTFALNGGVFETPVLTKAGGLFVQNGGTFNGTLTNRGTFSYGGGDFNGWLVNEGSLDLRAGFTGVLVNRGEVSIGTEAEIQLDGGLENDGTIVLAGGTLSGDGVLNNNCELNGFGTIAGTGGFVNNSLLRMGDGHLTLANNGGSLNAGTLILASGYQLRLNGGSLLNEGGLNLNGGAIAGTDFLTNGYGGSIYGIGSIACGFENDGTMYVDDGTINVSQPFGNYGVIDLLAPPATLAGGAILNYGAIQGAGNVGNGIDNHGTIEALDGTLVLGGIVSNRTLGLVAASAGAKVLFSRGLANNAGTISLSGGTFDNNGRALANAGQVSGYGTFRAGSWSNGNNMVFGGGSATINGSLLNAAAGRIDAYGNTTIFTGAITNNGLFKNTGATMIFAGAYVENGTYSSDPATNYFSDLVVGTSGRLLGSTGDVFVVGGDFLNATTQASTWDTLKAKLRFQSGGSHVLELPGADLGASPAGYASNYAWGTVELGSGQSLVLQDGNGTAGGAMYVSVFAMAGGTGQVSSITGNGLHVYYNALKGANAYLQGKTYALAGGGTLEPAVASLDLSSFVTQAGGHFAVQFGYTPDMSYKVWYSSNLVGWIYVPGAVLTYPAPGAARWLDDGSLTGGMGPIRFYKLMAE